MSSKYDDLLESSRPEHHKRQKMSRLDRAAQFSPFAALVGHEKALKKAERVLEEKPILVDTQQDDINRSLAYLRSKKSSINGIVRYFEEDEKQTGGIMKTYMGPIGIDLKRNEIVLDFKSYVPIQSIVSLLFDGEESDINEV